MIQINLLREPSRRKKLWAPKAQWKEYLLGAVMVVAVLGMLFWHWSLSGDKEQGLRTRVELQQQSLQLAAVRSELARYEAQRDRLEERSSVIEQLRASQKGPVRILNGVMSSMPQEPRLWLTRIEQNGTSLVLGGRAFDVPAIADFISALSRTPPFERVELSFWREDQDTLLFDLNCQVSLE